MLVAEPASFKVSFGKPGLTVGLAAFPPPPSGIARDPIVDMMLGRYVLYRDGGTILADAANFCLTALGVGAGSRKAAPNHYGIDKKVLSKLGELASTKGGAHARKAAAATADFAPRERQWLEHAMTLIIRRAAEVAFDPHAARRPITMADLPQL